MSRFSNDLPAVENSLTMAITWGLLPGLDCVVGTLVLFVLDWRLALVAAAVWPWCLLVSQRVAPRASDASYMRKRRKRDGGGDSAGDRRPCDRQGLQPRGACRARFPGSRRVHVRQQRAAELSPGADGAGRYPRDTGPSGPDPRAGRLARIYRLDHRRHARRVPDAVYLHHPLAAHVHGVLPQPASRTGWHAADRRVPHLRRRRGRSAGRRRQHAIRGLHRNGSRLAGLR